jgi:hypothetical protein
VIAFVKRTWMPLIVVVVVLLGGFVVYRMHGLFGSHNEITRSGAGLAEDAAPFDPKVVTYEIFGPEGAVATVNYLDLEAVPQKVEHAPLPWSITLSTTAPSASANANPPRPYRSDGIPPKQHPARMEGAMNDAVDGARPPLPGLVANHAR